jgi:Fe-S cluster assembly protein SufD
MSGIDQIRRNAAQRFEELGFPTTREEEWRFTNVAPIARTQFTPASAVRNRVLAEELIPYRGACNIVFVNGQYEPELSSGGTLGRSLRAANGRAQRHLAQYVSYDRHPFVALNTASFEDGAFVEIPDRAVIEEPIHLLFVTTGDERPVVSHPRSLIMIGAGSQATIVETYAGRGDRYFTNAVTEIVAADGAVVDHYRVQLEDDRSFHIGTTQAQLGRDVNFSTHGISAGSALSRNDVNAVLSEGSDATVNGLYLARDSQHVDNHTTIDHARPHGASHELYKGVLEGRSAAVFNGRIIVRPGAQKTDAKQTNRNLILSEDATINTKPELQIHADDVRCTHGATIGQLDRDAMFYLQSRGIEQKMARDLLTYAFAREILDRVKVDALRGRLEQVLWERFHARGSSS